MKKINELKDRDLIDKAFSLCFLRGEAHVLNKKLELEVEEDFFKMKDEIKRRMIGRGDLVMSLRGDKKIYGKN